MLNYLHNYTLFKEQLEHGMMILKSKCTNHPEEPAVTICQNCRTAICYRDVNKLFDRYNSQEYDLCLSCYKESQQNKLLKSFFVLIIIFIFIVFFGLSMIKQDPSGIISLFVIVVLLIFFGILFLLYYSYINFSIKEATERYEATNINGNDFTPNSLETDSKTHLHSHKDENNPELQQEIQDYVSWLFSGSDENKSTIHRVNTSLNHEQNSCPQCGTI